MRPQKDPAKSLGWREPMLWLVLGIPLATLAAGVWTLRIAAGDNATDAAPERVRRTAQVQVSDLAADEAAAAMGLRATLQRGSDHTLVLLKAPSGTGSLWLDAIHPVASEHDQRLRLQPDGDGRWRGGTLPDAQVAWHLRLSPDDGRWRLVGRIFRSQSDITLQPAIAPR